jgi:threonine dehydratase
LQSGKPIQLPEEKTLADSLMGGIGLDNRYTFRLVQELVDDIVLLTEEEIAGAMVYAVQTEHIVVEGGGAVGIGALLYGKVHSLGKQVAVVVSGGNVDMLVLTRLLSQAASEGSRPAGMVGDYGLAP